MPSPMYRAGLQGQHKYHTSEQVGSRARGETETEGVRTCQRNDVAVHMNVPMVVFRNPFRHPPCEYCRPACVFVNQPGKTSAKG